MAHERILVVEDEGITVLHIKKALEGLGYDVAGIAASGDDAIIKATEMRPDLVLMDIVLKGSLDGVDAAETIQAILNIPIIYLTAHADAATLQRAKVTGPFGYIVKPFRERDLSIAIEFALHKSRTEAERNHLTIRLQNALEKVKILSGLLPVCPSCMKTHDDEAYRTRLEDYLREHSGEDFSGSYCPACAEKIISDQKKER